MSTAVADQHPRPDVAPLGRMAAAQVRATLLFYWRNPAFFVFSLVLPVFFYAFFGLAFGRQRVAGNVTASYLIMAQMGAYAVSSILVFNIGIGQANRRATGQDRLLRATPLPSWIALFADIVGGLVLSLLSLLALFVLAVAAGGVRLRPLGWGSLLLRLVLGSLPLLGFGLAIGYGASQNAAPALANLIYLPMSFASGMFIPIQNLPNFVRTIAHYLPTYHYAQLVLGQFGVSEEELWRSVLWLAGWGIVLFAIAIRMYRLDQIRKFA